MRGHLRALATMMPFSVEKASLGSPAMLHSRILTASPSLDPLQNRLLAVHGSEHPQVAYHPRGDKHVPDEEDVLLPQRLLHLRPARVLPPQAPDELLRPLELLATQLHLLLQLLLLAHGRLQVVLHRLQLVDEQLQVRLLGIEGHHHHVVRPLRLRQLLLLGGHDLGDGVVAVHGAHPLAQPLRRGRRLGRVLRREVRVGDVRGADHAYDARDNVVLVVVLQLLDELGVPQQLLARLPVVIDHLPGAGGVWDLGGLHVQHHAHRLHHQLHGGGGVLEGLHQLDVRGLERVERVDGGVERRDGQCQRLLALLLDGVGRLALLLRLRHLPVHHLLPGLHHLDLLALDLGHQRLRVAHRLHQVGPQRGELRLHELHLLRGEGELVQPVGVALALAGHLRLLDTQQCAEEAQQLQIAGGSDVVVAARLVLELLRQQLHVHVELLAHLHDVGPLLVRQLHVLEELHRHRLQRVLRPRLEPVDGAAVDDGGELPQPLAEGVADGAEAQHDVQVELAPLHKVPPQLRGRLQDPAERFRLRPHRLVHRRLLVHREQVGHLAAVEDVVDVLHKRLVLDLRVAEQKNGRLVLRARQPQRLLQVLLPLVDVVTLADLNLDHLHVRHEPRQPRQRLPPAAPHPGQQHVRPWLLERAAHAADVLHRVEEHGEVHGALAHAVEVGEVLLHLADQGVHVRHLLVKVLLVHVVPEEAPPQVLRGHLPAAAHQVAEEVVEGGPKVLLRRGLQKAEEPASVPVVHQPVEEDAEHLVDPQPQALRARRRRLRGQAPGALQQHALHHAAHVAQVEGVVALGGRGKQLGHGGLVHLHDAEDDGLRQLLDGVGEAARLAAPLQDDTKDVLECGDGELHNGVHVEVPLEAHGDLVAPAPRGAHRRHQLHVHQLAEGVVAVVPPLVVRVLAKQLHGRLRTVRLQDGHVQVVHHDDALLAHRGAKLALAPLVQLAVNQELRGVGAGAGGEGHKVEHVVLLAEALHQVPVHVHTLARARGPHKQDHLVVLDSDVQQEGRARSVHCGDDQLRKLRVVRDGGSVQRRCPLGPLPVPEAVPKDLLPLRHRILPALGRLFRLAPLLLLLLPGPLLLRLRLGRLLKEKVVDGKPVVRRHHGRLELYGLHDQLLGQYNEVGRDDALHCPAQELVEELAPLREPRTAPHGPHEGEQECGLHPHLHLLLLEGGKLLGVVELIQHRCEDALQSGHQVGVLCLRRLLDGVAHLCWCNPDAIHVKWLAQRTHPPPSFVSCSKDIPSRVVHHPYALTHERKRRSHDAPA
eukprot:102756-Prorocentrum_minimum.AAC.2